MNKERRKRVNEIIQGIEELKAEVEGILDEETEYRDNIPENMQQSERYENADTNCYNLQYAIDNIEEAVSNLEESQN